MLKQCYLTKEMPELVEKVNEILDRISEFESSVG